MARVSVTPAVWTLVERGGSLASQTGWNGELQEQKGFHHKKKEKWRTREQDIPFYLCPLHIYAWASPPTYTHTHTDTTHKRHKSTKFKLYIHTCVHTRIHMCVYLYIKLVELLALWFFAWLIYHFRQESYFFNEILIHYFPMFWFLIQIINCMG